MSWIRAVRRISALKLRTKLIIFYILLVTLPIFTVSYINFRISSDIILNNASQNLQSILKRNNQFTDIIMKNVQDASLSLLADPDIFHLFNRKKPDDLLELLRMDRKVSEISNKYFGSITYIDNVQLVTSEYSFGGTASLTSRPTFVSVKPRKLQSSQLYQDTLAADGSLVWFPTYDIAKQFDQMEFASIEPRYRYVFSAARMMKGSIVENGEIKAWQRGNEPPLLLVNFSESFFRTLKNEIGTDASSMLVISPNGEVISHPDSSQLTRHETSEWLDTIKQGKSGSTLASIGGRKMLICYDSSEVTSWITVLFVPYDKVISNLPLINKYSLYIALLLILISIIAAFIISGWLTTPMKKLLVAFQLTGSGNFTAKIPAPKDLEFGILIHKFNVMTDKISDLIKENYEVKLREQEAEIMALNLQLNPHFLYNTLNIINWMALDKDQDEISKMITSLSTMLHYAVKTKQETVPFEDDLTWLKSYLHIMEKRYFGVFTVEYDLEGMPKGYTVPKMFLQPFIENSIIHGFASRSEGGIIRISAVRHHDRIEFKVEDNGQGISTNTQDKLLSPDAPGVGMMNVQNRIKLLYGEEYGVHIHSGDHCGTTVSIFLPPDNFMHIPVNGV